MEKNVKVGENGKRLVGINASSPRCQIGLFCNYIFFSWLTKGCEISKRKITGCELNQLIMYFLAIGQVDPIFLFFFKSWLDYYYNKL